MLKQNYDGVVFGSHTLAEYKCQVVAFMDRVYYIIVEDNDYSLNGCSNLRPWTHNLMFYIRKCEEEMPHDYEDLNICVYSKILAIRHNLETLTGEVTSQHVFEVKHLCCVLWKDVLETLRHLYGLEYEIESRACYDCY